MTVLRYPRSALIGDLVRGSIGIAVASAPLILAEPSAWMTWVLGAALALFAAFIVAAACRARRCFGLGPSGICVLPSGAAVSWQGLDCMRLGYFSTRRDGRDGWMELRLDGDGARLSVDSRLEGFEQVLSRAARAAEERGLHLSAATRRNLEAVGIKGMGSAGNERP